MATWEEVRAAASKLPGVTEERRQWKVKSGLLAWERPLRKADLDHLGPAAPTGDILGIRTVDLEAKEELLAAFPGVFFTTPHFNGYPAVLARLAELDVSVLEQLLQDVWLDRAPKKLVKAWQAGKAP
jgi:hypothetical protein